MITAYGSVSRVLSHGVQYVLETIVDISYNSAADRHMTPHRFCLYFLKKVVHDGAYNITGTALLPERDCPAIRFGYTLQHTVPFFCVCACVCVFQVGYFTTDHFFEPCPTVTRAVHEAAEGLRASGHEVVPFEPPVTGWEVCLSSTSVCIYYFHPVKRNVVEFRKRRVVPSLETPG